MEQQRQPPPPPAYLQQRRPSRWWIPVLIIAVIIAVILVLLIGGIALTISAFEKSPVVVRQNTVLWLDARGLLRERAPESPLSIFTEPVAPTHFEILQAIRVAQRDPNIAAIAFETSQLQAGWVKTSEIIAALDSFRSAGKPVYAYIEFGNERDYYLASVADSIFMPPNGILEFNGFGILSMFFKKALSRLGIEFYVEALEEYKSAGEAFSRTGFSAAAREEYAAVLRSIETRFLRTVSRHRNISPDTLRSLLRQGVYMPQKFRAYGLVDSLMTYAQFLDFLRQRVMGDSAVAGGMPELRVQVQVNGINVSKRKLLRKISVARYLSSTSFLEAKERLEKARKTIAVIVASGSIVPKSSKELREPSVVAERDYVQYLERVARDTTIAGVLLRIDSPGGSASASDGIWSAIQKVRARKPIYAVLSDVAASGGYYIASGCDTIIAHPLSLTGSIGVIIIHPSLAHMLENLSIAVDTITTSPTATDLNVWQPLEAREKAILRRLADESYRTFLERVAAGRKMTTQMVRQVAKGRVWMGDTAKSLGLVDVLGGFDAAVKLMKARIGVPDSEQVRLRFYPRPKDPLERLIELFFQDWLAGVRAEANSPHRTFQQWLAMFPPLWRTSLWHLWLLAQQAYAGEYVFAVHPWLPEIQ